MFILVFEILSEFLKILEMVLHNLCMSVGDLLTEWP